MAECQRLRDEIGRLRQILIDNDIDPDPSAPQREATAQSNLPCVQLTTQQKIELFRSLFRGREDVYAVRWENPDGRHGYSPVAQRDWKAYNSANIEDRKRVDKETRKYVPLSWKGTLQQYVGRLHRLHDNKRVVEVYDYVDSNVLMLARMYERRLRGYADMGYKITSGLPEQPRLIKDSMTIKAQTYASRTSQPTASTTSSSFGSITLTSVSPATKVVMRTFVRGVRIFT